MEDKELKSRYIKEFDDIHASEDLRKAVKNLKPQKQYRRVTPLKATIGTVAAAVMIVVAVHDYTFKPDTSGVISEKVTSTQLPEAQFEVIEKTEKPTETATQKPIQTNNSVIVEKPTIKPAEKPIAAPSPEPTQTAEIAQHSEETVAAATPNGDTALLRSVDDVTYTTVTKWSLEEYYEYLGVNVSQRIAGTYTGTQTFEFELGSDGIPMDDTAVLSFMTDSGASVRVTVSKHVLFDATLSGTVNEAGAGYNAYKLSNGVYYNVYMANTTLNEVNSIVAGL